MVSLRTRNDLESAADPFLLAHYVAPCSFDIGGPVSPISIRDQMIRGQLIIDRALATKPPLIDRKRRSLLVVGAGVGGVTAALQAARKGVQVTLVDWEFQPFRLQGGCATRFLDPTQYDWPMSHWRDRNFPPGKRAHLMKWSAARANAIASGWHAKLILEAKKLPNLKIHFGTTVDGLPSFGRLYQTDAKGATELSYEHIPFGAEGTDVFVQVHLRQRLLGASKDDPSTAHWIMPAQEFGMLLTSVGFGRERIEATDVSGKQVFHSLAFWEADDYETGRLGNKPADKACVLISGSGDGALQDLVRIVTRHNSAGELFETIAGSLSTRDPGWLEVERRVHEAEDQAQRAFAWGPAGAYDHAVLSSLQKDHLRAIALLKKIPARTGHTLWDHVCSQLDDLFSKLNPPVPSITFAHSCDHFANCYALNRFLVLLLLTYLDEKKEESSSFAHRIQWHKYTRVDSVTGVKHKCMSNAQDCYGLEHEVQFVNQTCEGRSRPYASLPSTQIFDIIVLRHGVEIPFSSLRLVDRPRQVLPYYLPR